MLIGIDFDNTIVSYDGVFHKLAVENGLIPEDPPASKGQVRDYLRQRGQENAWIELQGSAYGTRMLEARPFPGALEFFCSCKDQGISVCIVSHRTRYPFMGPRYDLHQAAREWVEHYDFFEQTGVLPERVYFELSKQEKLNRIRQQGCDLFIDDLPEFLAEEDFPPGVRRILFDPNGRYPMERRFERITSWKQIRQSILKEARSV